MDEIRLATFLCSRLCHDLVSPIGALNNGVEVLEEETSAAIRAEALKLLGESAKAAIARLLFFRLAFGAATGLGSEVGLKELHQAATGLYDGTRVKLDWPGGRDDAAKIEKTRAKLLLNLMLLAGEALLKGGTLRPGLGGGDAVVIEAEGPAVALPEDLATTLIGEEAPEEVDLRSAQALFARRLAESLGARIQIDKVGERKLRLWVAV